jgi:hypothetical protein
MDMIKHSPTTPGLPKYRYPTDKVENSQNEAASHCQENLMTRVSSTGQFIEHFLALRTLR